MGQLIVELIKLTRVVLEVVLYLITNPTGLL